MQEWGQLFTEVQLVSFKVTLRLHLTFRQAGPQQGQLPPKFKKKFYLLDTITSYNNFAPPKISTGCGPADKYTQKTAAPS